MVLLYRPGAPRQVVLIVLRFLILISAYLMFLAFKEVERVKVYVLRATKKHYSELAIAQEQLDNVMKLCCIVMECGIVGQERVDRGIFARFRGEQTRE